MKVILKGGSGAINNQIMCFFEMYIEPIFSEEIAYEWSSRQIVVRSKCADGTFKDAIDPTVEVIVELAYDVIERILDNNPTDEQIREMAGIFLGEALAIKMLEKLNVAENRPFSVEYYSCRYSCKKTL